MLLLMMKTTKKHLLFLKSYCCYYCCLVSGSGVAAEAQQQRVAFLTATVTYSSRAATTRYSSTTTTTSTRGSRSVTTMPASSSKPSSAYASSPGTAVPYVPPSWCNDRLLNVPKHGRLQIANLPTPLYQVQVETSTSTINSNSDNTSADNTSSSATSSSTNNNNPFLQAVRQNNMTLLIKRDDCTSGVELGGNKIRKLEFLIADALACEYDSVVTIGGQQSNHCRATAAISRMVGLQPHLILRTSSPPTGGGKGDDQDNNQNDLGLIGNLLVDRMVGSQIYTCTPGEYGRIGSNELIARLCTLLRDNGRKPYPIPVGGSNGLGTWGYINAVQEIISQLQQQQGHENAANLPSLPDHIVFACGSGGTAAGIALGIALAYNNNNNNKSQSQVMSPPPKVHAVGVCDDPNYFYKHVATIAKEMGLVVDVASDTSSSVSSLEEIEEFIRENMIVHQGKGLGYAKSTPEELEFVSSFARETGIVLDPVYSGKALYKFYKDVLLEDTGGEYHGQSVLFWHTGGALGLYDKCDDLIASLKDVSPCQRLDVYGKGNGIDLSIPSTSTTS